MSHYNTRKNAQNATGEDEGAESDVQATQDRPSGTSQESPTSPPPPAPAGMMEMLAKLMEGQTKTAESLTRAEEAAVARSEEAATRMEERTATLLAEQTTRMEERTARMEERTATLLAEQTSTIEGRMAESLTRVEEKTATLLAEQTSALEGRIREETDRLKESFHQDLERVRERGEETQREVGRQREELDSVCRRMTTVESRQDALEDSVKTSLEKVNSDNISLTIRLNEVQRELYSRVSVVETSRANSSVCNGSLAVSVPTNLSGGQPARIKPSAYDGKQSFHLYKLQFDTISGLNQWDENERAQYLISSLCGGALSVLSNISATDRLSYEKLCKILNDRFTQNKSSELAVIKLDNRVRGRTETLQSYGFEMEQLVSSAYPSLNEEAREIILKERFLRGLDSELRRQVKLSRPSTYEATISIASEIEAVLIGETSDRSHRQVRRVEDQTINYLDQIETSRGDNHSLITRRDQAGGRNNNHNDNALNRKNRGIICHRCFLKNHVQRDCYVDLEGPRYLARAREVDVNRQQENSKITSQRRPIIARTRRGSDGEAAGAYSPGRDHGRNWGQFHTDSSDERTERRNDRAREPDQGRVRFPSADSKNSRFPQ